MSYELFTMSNLNEAQVTVSQFGVFTMRLHFLHGFWGEGAKTVVNRSTLFVGSCCPFEFASLHGMFSNFSKKTFLLLQLLLREANINNYVLHSALDLHKKNLQAIHWWNNSEFLGTPFRSILLPALKIATTMERE